MQPLYRDPGFTFRFIEDRIISRIHLEGVEVGRRISLLPLASTNAEKPTLIAWAIVGENGWVELAEPIIVRAGDGFVAMVDE